MAGSVLDREQLGHLRHWDNLSRQLPNDWSGMQGKGTSQEDFGGYRFQLAYMIYGLALTHRHRLPAAPGAIRPTMQGWPDTADAATVAADLAARSRIG